MLALRAGETGGGGREAALQRAGAVVSSGPRMPWSLALVRRRAPLAWLSGQIVLAACGGDPRGPAERAEPPPEPTLRAEGFADPPDGLRLVGDIRFRGGAVIGARELAPAPARPGEPLQVRMRTVGLRPGQPLRIGLQAPQTAGRQEPLGQTTRPRGQVRDLRERWVEVEAAGEELAVELPVPAPWHPAHAVIVLELPGDVAVQGPRRADGVAILGAVPVVPRPTEVEAPRAAAVVVDGRLDEPCWRDQAGAVLGQSLDGEPDPGVRAPPAEGALASLEPELGTRVAFAWDERFLYAAAALPDADLWSDYAAQDDPLYKQEAFELFVAAGGEGERYLEYQVSARGVTFDARFPRYRAGDEAWDSAWTTAVQVEGSVNDVRDRDRGWRVELAIPWDELCRETALACPPAPGMRLRVNAFRLEREGRKRAIGLSLSPTRAPDFHAWGNAAALTLR